MSDINDQQHSIDVAAPVRVAYNQWTQFEEFPQFMDGVKSITQLGDNRLSWVVEIAGVTRNHHSAVSE